MVSDLLAWACLEDPHSMHFLHIVFPNFYIWRDQVTYIRFTRNPIGTLNLS